MLFKLGGDGNVLDDTAYGLGFRSRRVCLLEWFEDDVGYYNRRSLHYRNPTAI